MRSTVERWYQTPGCVARADVLCELIVIGINYDWPLDQSIQHRTLDARKCSLRIEA